jgi:hypothetical protein
MKPAIGVNRGRERIFEAGGGAGASIDAAGAAGCPATVVTTAPDTIARMVSFSVSNVNQPVLAAAVLDGKWNRAADPVKSVVRGGACPRSRDHAVRCDRANGV